MPRPDVLKRNKKKTEISELEIKKQVRKLKGKTRFDCPRCGSLVPCKPCKKNKRVRRPDGL